MQASHQTSRAGGFAGQLTAPPKRPHCLKGGKQKAVRSTSVVLRTASEFEL